MKEQAYSYSDWLKAYDLKEFPHFILKFNQTLTRSTKFSEKPEYLRFRLLKQLSKLIARAVKLLTSLLIIFKNYPLVSGLSSNNWQTKKVSI